MRGILAALGALLLVVPGTTVTAAPESFDTLVKGGSIIDGTGSPAYVGDIGIRGDRIVRIGELSGATASTVVDAHGQVVAPGFIDLMMGAYLGDRASLATNENMIQMGVTTGMIAWEGGSVQTAQEKRSIEQLGTASNVVMFFPILTAWGQVMGEAKAKPTAAQLDQMKAIARRSLEEGAFGVGAAIEYCPLCNADTESIIEIAREAKAFNAYYASHIRNEANGVVNATVELIRIAEEAGIPAQVGHMKVAGAPNCGLSNTTIGLIRDAQARGLDVSSSQYPYTAGQTTDIGYLIPDWAEQGTEAEQQLRFRDPSQRPRILQGIQARIEEVVGTPDKIEFRPHGTTLKQEADTRRVNAAEAVLQIRENEQTRLTIIHFGCPFDMENILVQPWNSIGTDMGPWVPIHELTPYHPRGYGTFPRILGEYVRVRQLLTLEDAVRKMTGQSAYRTGLASAQRGLLQEGWYADVTVFDPKEVIDRATYQDPGEFSKGITWVFVNGVVMKKNGELTPLHERVIAKPGRVLTHTKEMPSLVQPGYDARPAAAAEPMAEPKRTAGFTFLLVAASLALAGATMLGWRRP